MFSTIQEGLTAYEKRVMNYSKWIEERSINKIGPEDFFSTLSTNDRESFIMLKVILRSMEDALGIKKHEAEKIFTRLGAVFIE